MRMERVIRERRLALGLTQEQVAGALGVTAPAVNKWEKGASCPDLGLLCPLARLLGIDVNELLGFRAELSDAEVQKFSLEVLQLADAQGLDAAFERARALMREYPSCGYLAYTLAALLQWQTAMGTNVERREEYQAQIDAWFELAAECDDERVRGRVREMLAGRYISRGDWDAARRIIDAMPERPGLDKRAAKANLCLQLGEYEEAAKLAQGVLYSAASEVCTTLQWLMESEIKLGELERAKKLAETVEQVVKTLELWPFIGTTARFQCAMTEKDAEGAMRALERMVEALDEPWRPGKSALYWRIAGEKEDKMNERLWPVLASDLETNPDYEFLRNTPGFAALSSKLRDRVQAAQ